MRDFKFAVRRLAAAPVFTLFSIATLAVGIGVTTAVYSFLYALLWRAPTVPTTPGSLLNCARQTDSDRSATAGAFGRSSDASSVRPAIARRPSTWK